MKKIISFIDLKPDQIEQIKRQYDLILQPTVTELSCLEPHLAEAVALIVDPLHFDSDLIELAKNVKVISTVSVGYNHLPLMELRKRKIIATHTPYVLNDTVADTVMGLMLCSARRLSEMDAYVKDGQWRTTIGPRQFGLDVHHKKLGIIGMGRIGSVIAKRAKLGFDMSVSYYNRSVNHAVEEQLGVNYQDLDQLLATSDFVVLMVPLTTDTENFMDLAKFKKMKASAVFVNASRGRTVDEAALVEAIDNGYISRAALDVFVEEPLPADHPFLTRTNIVTTPHIGSATQQTRDRMKQAAIDNMLMALNGERPTYLIEALQDSGD